MKIIYIILLFFSLCTICFEISNFKFYRRLKVQQDIDKHFVLDTMYYLSSTPAGSDDACSSCHYYFKGVLKKNKDTVTVLGQFDKYSELLKRDNDLDKRLYFNVWYSKLTNTAIVNKSNDVEKFKPKIFNLFFLNAWIAYIFMFSSIPILVVLINKRNEN